MARFPSRRVRGTYYDLGTMPHGKFLVSKAHDYVLHEAERMGCKFQHSVRLRYSATEARTTSEALPKLHLPAALRDHLPAQVAIFAEVIHENVICAVLSITRKKNF